MPTILRRPASESDLLDIWEYIDAQSGTDQANAIIWQIERSLITLSNHPGMGRNRGELSPGLRSHPTGRYMLFYIALEDGVELVRVLHGSRNATAVFDQESLS